MFRFKICIRETAVFLCIFSFQGTKLASPTYVSREDKLGNIRFHNVSVAMVPSVARP